MDKRCEITRLIKSLGIWWGEVVSCQDSSFLDTKQWDFQTLLQIRLTPTVQLKETANFRILD